MTEYEDREIKDVTKLIAEEMKRIEQMEKSEYIGRAVVLDRMFKFVRDYDELTPLLERYYEAKHYRDKWEKEK